MKKQMHHSLAPEFCGTVNVGERGQVVIPKQAREGLGLRQGDSLVAMIHNHALIFLPKKQMTKFVKALAKKFNI